MTLKFHRLNSNVSAIIACVANTVKDHKGLFTLIKKHGSYKAIIRQFSAKFPHSPILHYSIYTCRLLLTENNGKNNVIAVGLCAVFVVSWWRNKGLHTLNRMHNEVWGHNALLKRVPVFLHKWWKRESFI